MFGRSRIVFVSSQTVTIREDHLNNRSEKGKQIERHVEWRQRDGDRKNDR